MLRQARMCSRVSTVALRTISMETRRDPAERGTRASPAKPKLRLEPSPAERSPDGPRAVHAALVQVRNVGLRATRGRTGR